MPADQTPGTRPVCLAPGDQWQSSSDTGATVNAARRDQLEAAGTHLATAVALVNAPEHAQTARMPSTTPFSDDVAALKALLLERDALLVQRDGELQCLHDTVSTLELALSVRTLEIEQLTLQIAKLKRMVFGRKSEKIDKKLEQLETGLEDLIAEEGTAEQASPIPVASRQKSVHKPLPEHLLREDHILEPLEDACPQCGGLLKALGEDVSEQLEMIESAFKVFRHIRKKKACACCDCIVQAPAPSRPIQRSFAGPALLANIAVSKFADHQPLYRQAVIHARQGVELDPATTGRWMGACGVLLAPLVEALRRYVLASVKIHSDDTTIPVFAPGNGQSKIARLWVYVRDNRNSGSAEPPAVWFAYSPNRQGLHPQTHLAGFAGVLQADAYPGYDKIFNNGLVIEAACMAHARRKIHDLHVKKATPNDDRNSASDW